jgi:hypothetical protein
MAVTTKINYLDFLKENVVQCQASEGIEQAAQAKTEQAGHDYDLLLISVSQVFYELSRMNFSHHRCRR